MSFTDAGYGFQIPDDANSDLTGVAFIVRQMIAQLDTMKLVKVIAVHSNGAVAAAGTVDVQPLVNQIDGATPPNATPHGTVYGIPWFRLQGGKSAVICDPVKGDVGYVDCSDRDISVVKKTGAVGNPGSLRRYNIADGVYVGMVVSQVVPTQYVLFKQDSNGNPTGVKVVDPYGNIIETAQAGITITDANGNVLQMQSGLNTLTGNLKVTGTLEVDKLETGENGLNVTGAITATGEVTGNGITLSTHTHPVTTAPGETGAPVG